jgi:hypothetical protein
MFNFRSYENCGNLKRSYHPLYSDMCEDNHTRCCENELCPFPKEWEKENGSWEWMFGYPISEINDKRTLNNHLPLPLERLK